MCVRLGLREGACASDMWTKRAEAKEREEGGWEKGHLERERRVANQTQTTAARGGGITKDHAKH